MNKPYRIFQFLFIESESRSPFTAPNRGDGPNINFRLWPTIKPGPLNLMLSNLGPPLNTSVAYIRDAQDMSGALIRPSWCREACVCKWLGIAFGWADRSGQEAATGTRLRVSINGSVRRFCEVFNLCNGILETFHTTYFYAPILIKTFFCTFQNILGKTNFLKKIGLVLESDMQTLHPPPSKSGTKKMLSQKMCNVLKRMQK